MEKEDEQIRQIYADRLKPPTLTHGVSATQLSKARTDRAPLYGPLPRRGPVSNISEAKTTRSGLTNQARRDHLAEYYHKMSAFKSASTVLRSQNAAVHAYTDEFKADLRDHDFQHHLKRDSHTVYTEASVVMKPHLRNK